MNNRNTNNDMDTIDLLKIIRLILSKLWAVLIAMIVFGGAAFAVSYFMMPRMYQSYTSLYVKNANSANIDDKTSVNINDINASKSLVNTYIAVLSDDAVMEQVSERLLEKVGPARLSEVLSVDLSSERIKITNLKSCISMAAVNQTEVLKVTAVTSDADISAVICNTVAEVAPEVLIRVVGAGSVEAIGEAKPIITPVSPNIKRNSLLGAIAGFVLAVAIIIIADLLDNTVKSSKELTDKFEKAIIGEIQGFGVTKKEIKEAKRSTDVKRATLLDPKTPFNVKESYKAMRTNIVFSLSTSDNKAFAVSSANPGEGKSTTAVNIAIALSQAEHKVLLIDGDMRKPVQHKVFDRKNHNGLSSVISGMKPLNDCIQKEVLPNLDLMSSGPKPPNPSELLASERCSGLIEELKDLYDYIVIDTPPINVVSDAMGLSSSIAGIIMVTRYGITTFDAAEDAMQKLELADMNLLGFVLNDISAKEAGAYSNYKYKYRSYGKYGYGKYGYGKYGYGKYGYGGYSSYGYGYGEEPEEQENDSEKEEKTSKEGTESKKEEKKDSSKTETKKTSDSSKSSSGNGSSSKKGKGDK